MIEDISPTLRAAINAHDTTGSFALSEVVEIYAHDYQPDPANGFEPADAEERFGMVEGLTISGLAYRREYTGRGDIQLQMDKRENTVTCNFNNVPDASGDRYMAAWAQAGEIEGKWLVIRIYTPDSLNLSDTLVRFCGRLDKPGDFSDESCSLSATQRLGQANQKFPPRRFGPNDPKGRAPNDPLFEGFRFTPAQGSLQYTTRERRQGFGGLLGLTKKITHTLQFSSHANFESEMAVPDAFGRVQLPHIFLATIDIGGAINCSLAFAEGPVAEYASFRQVNPKFSAPRGPVFRYGHLGGEGPPGREQVPVKQTNPTFNVPGDGYYSRTAWAHCSVIGSTVDVDEAEAPAFAALIKAKIVPLPDGTGLFVVEGWTHNPAYIARFLIADPRYFNEGEAAVDDAICWETGLWCADYVIDTSQGERAFVPSADLPGHGTLFERYNSTGVINARRIRMEELGTLSGDPFLSVRDDLDDFDPIDPPPTIAPRSFLRERYTCNLAVTEEVEAVKLFYDTVCPTGRLFTRRSSKGQVEIHSEKPADNTRLRASTAAGATAIPVFDVEPWRASLAQQLLTGAHQLTSEVRTVTATDYTADGNAITLAASKTGGVTVSASGATLAGGSSSAAASGTVTIGGSPAAGNTVTVTVAGIAVTYTLDASDTTATVAAMLARLIHATPSLRQFVKATWGGSNVLTIAARYGVLTVNSALINAHSAGIANPTTAPAGITVGSAASTLLPGDYLLAYANTNAAGSTVVTPATTVTISTSNQVITIPAIALPAGATGRDWYLSRAPGDSELVLAAHATGSGFNIAAPPDPTNDLPPDTNTTAEELIRVAMSFASNDQDPYPVWQASKALTLNDIYLPTIPNGHKYKVTTAGTTGASEPAWPITSGGTVASGTAVFTEFGSTILGQAGLTRSQVHKNTFRWPGGNKQSTVNQVAGTFYDSTDDFAPTPLVVNDYAHQARTRKENKKEVDLSGFDNYHQASRYLNFLLSKNREGDFFAQLSTGPRGILLEEGDVCCGSTANGGFVNLPFRSTEIGIGPPPTYTTRVAGHRYSTLMFSDQVRQHSIRLPTTLRHSVVLNTEIQLIDLPHWREADAEMGSGFHLALWRAAGIGDWRGSAVDVDAGEGYRQAAAWDVEASAGEATQVSSFGESAYGRNQADTVRVQVREGATLSTYTEEEFRAGAGLYRLGGEIFQARVAALVGGTDDTYDLTDVIRGRFGTEGDTAGHTAGEEFTVLDSRVLFVPVDAKHAGREIKVRARTVGQDAADAAEHTFTWEGKSRQPLSPARIDTDETTQRAPRDSSGHAAVTVWPRSNYGEIGDEYRVRCLTDLGAEIAGASITFRENIPVSAVLVSDADPSNKYAAVTKNTLRGTYGTATAAGSNIIAARSLQRIIRTDNIIEATLEVKPGGDSTTFENVASLSLIHEGAPWQRVGEVPDTSVSIHTGKVSGKFAEFTVRLEAVQLGISPFVRYELSVWERNNGVAAVDSLTTPALTNKVRVRIALVGGEARAYWTQPDLAFGPGMAPLGRSVEPVRYPVRVLAQARTDDDYVRNVMLTTNPLPSTVISVEQQTAWYGGAKDPMLVEIEQHSGIREVGWGFPRRLWI